MQITGEIAHFDYVSCLALFYFILLLFFFYYYYFLPAKIIFCLHFVLSIIIQIKIVPFFYLNQN